MAKEEYKEQRDIYKLSDIYLQNKRRRQLHNIFLLHFPLIYNGLYIVVKGNYTAENYRHLYDNRTVICNLREVKCITENS